MRKLLFIFFLITINKSFADNKNEIINHFEKIDNLNFKFEQNINGQIETGNCTIHVSYTHLTLPTILLV